MRLLLIMVLCTALFLAKETDANARESLLLAEAGQLHDLDHKKLSKKKKKQSKKAKSKKRIKKSQRKKYRRKRNQRRKLGKKKKSLKKSKGRQPVNRVALPSQTPVTPPPHVPVTPPTENPLRPTAPRLHRLPGVAPVIQFTDSQHNNVHFLAQDITRLNVDAIINAANRNLLAGGGVCGAIFRGVETANPGDHNALQQECDLHTYRRGGSLNDGDAVITGSYGLPSRYIIHAVGPVWPTTPEAQAQAAASLRRAYQNIFRLVEEYNIRSIALVAISTSIFRYPLDQATTIALQEIRAFAQRRPDVQIYITNPRRRGGVPSDVETEYRRQMGR